MPGISQRHRDAPAHGARADDGRFANRVNRRVFGYAGHFGDGTLGEEGMNQSLSLRGTETGFA
jgi:hypothetical protein